jgi:hypothetical protein
MPPSRTNGFAIAALVLGIAACSIGLIAILGLIAIPLAIIGLVLGIFGIVRSSRSFGAGKTMAMIGTGLCVLGLALAVIGLLNASRAFSDRDSPRGDTTSSRTEVRTDDLDVQFDKYVDDGNPSIETGKLPVTLTNKGNVSASFKVELEALDATGKRIDDDTAYAANLAPGKSTMTYMFALVASPKISDMTRATFRIVKVSKY